MLKTFFPLVLLASSALAQTTFPAPRGWTVQEQPSMLVLAPSQSSSQTVNAEVYDPEPATGSLRDWFEARAESAGAPSGACRPSMKNGYMTCVAKYNGHDNYLYGIELQDGRYRFVHFNMGASGFGAFRYVSPLAQIIRAAQTSSAQSTVTPPPQQQQAQAGARGWPKQSQPPAQAQTQAAAEAPQTPPVTRPSATSSYLPEMTGLYLHEEYGSGVGGMITISYEPYILFPDGTITSDLYYIPSSEADMPQWRARKPKWWGTYTKSGKTINIRWNDPRTKPETWERWFVARPGTEGMPFTGLYQSMGGGGNTALGGTVMIAAWKDFKFFPNGTVVKGGGSGSMTSGPGANVATSNSKRPSQASYKIHPYTIDLQYGDGHSERQWFYRFPDSDDVIGIGGSTYIRDK